MKSKLLGLGVAAVMAALCSVTPAQATPVDLELVLAVDVSGSIDTNEFNLQKKGYVDAFNSATVQNAINSGRSLAATLVYWSGVGQVQQAVSWRLIDSAADAAAFAALINGTSRVYSGMTDLSGAITYSRGLFASNGFEGSRLVLDVSGDGADNDPSAVSSVNAAATKAARDAAVAAGITINGLPILGSETGLDTYYAANVVGGTNSFLEVANSFDDFGRAIETKIGREIVNEPVPEPSTFMLLGAGILGVGLVRRRMKK